MRVLILSQYFSPEPIPKPMELAAALQAAGNQVTVITGFPNYPSGQLYEGYKLGIVRREQIEGVQVLRTFEYPYHGTRALGRFANYLSFMLSAPLGSFFAPRFDAIYVWHPPLTIGVAAWLIAKMRGIPFVYDVQDIWPEAAVLSGILKPGFIVRCLSALERFIYRRASHLLVVTEGARSNLVSKGVPSEKISVMPHWFDDSLFQSLDATICDSLRAQHGWEGKFVVLFAGNLGLVQGLETVIRAAALLRNDHLIRFAFVGDGADKSRLEKLVETLDLTGQIQFIERQSMDRMPAYLAAADVLLVHLKPSELSNYVIPTKTLAYLASGRPILMAMHGAAAVLVQDAKAGCVVPPDAPDELAAAVRAFVALPPEQRAEMGRRGKEYLALNLSKEIIIPRYVALLDRLVGIS